MHPTFLGLVVVLIGFAALFSPVKMALRVALMLSLLGAGAVVVLPALGGASILAGPAFTGFLMLRNLLTRGGVLRFLSAYRPGTPGFWLMVAIGYGIFTAFFVAPFFYGHIMVFPISRGGADGAEFSQEYFGFSSGNLTQSVYAIGQLILYGSVTALIVTRKLHRTVLDGLVALGVAHVAVSLLDLATYYTHTSFLLDWLRTANYTSWTDNQIAGLKRISGLFPEASMYAIYAMTILGVTFRLVLSRYRLRITQPVFCLTLILLLMSTSTTAYVSLALAVMVILVVGLRETWFLSRFRTLRSLLIFGLSIMMAATVALVVFPGAMDTVQRLFSDTIVNKMDTSSGVNRSEMNVAALQTFFDTYLLGAGIGSVRTSSFAMTLLSNLGAFGTVAYLIFVAGLYGRDKSLKECGQETELLAEAARWGVISTLIAASTSFHVFDLGPLFYILAALAHPRLYVPARVPAPTPRFRTEAA